jgi:hypothetical protein
MNEPKPLLMLPAPDMTRWIFYKKKPDFGQEATKPANTARTFKIMDMKTSNMSLDVEEIQAYMQSLQDQINEEWRKLFGPDWPLF